MNAFAEGIITIAIAVVGLAVVSVLVSPKAQTSSLVQSLASGFGNSIGVAESPVTGNNVSLSLGYPAPNSLASSFGG